ncbi:hypothetical protein SAMN05216518_12714 [Bacteroidales bacterium KHT7]|nr:hypothetical protein SAMN05216518_12714 [Bacteroidales bacterium KHT7]
MKKYIVILLCILVSCCKREPSVGTHQGDNATVSPSKTKGIDGYVGKWHYMVWINDSAYQNKSFWLELRKTGKIYVKGVFASIWDNGYRLDGWNADTDVETNVWGRFVNDSLYVRIKGSYRENSSAKAVLYLVNDSTLLWKLTEENGEIYLPDKVWLEKDNQ